MGIAYVTGNTGTGSATTTIPAATITVSGTNLIAIVSIYSSGGTVSGTPTFAGTNITPIFTDVALDGRHLYVGFVIAPAAGSQGVTGTLSGSGTINTQVVLYSGALQSGQPDSSNSGGDAVSNSKTVSTTVVLPGCWLVGCGGETSSGGPSITTTRLNSGNNVNLQSLIGDSNGVVSTGSQSLSFTMNNGSSGCDFVVLSIAPAPNPPVGKIYVPRQAAVRASTY